VRAVEDARTANVAPVLDHNTGLEYDVGFDDHVLADLVSAERNTVSGAIIVTPASSAAVATLSAIPLQLPPTAPWY